MFRQISTKSHSKKHTTILRKCFFVNGLLALGVVALTMVGCASSGNGGGVETRAYIADKERVDQKMEGGNFGYVGGTPKAPDRSKIRKTRQVYTLEFTKNPDITPDELRKPVPPAAPVVINVPERRTRVTQQEPEPIIIRRFEPDRSEETISEGTGKEYVVEKGDTLQKISKKFYDSYSKWNKIYEANKDIIPNPNKIKPGLTIRIPE